MGLPVYVRVLSPGVFQLPELYLSTSHIFPVVSMVSIVKTRYYGEICQLSDLASQFYNWNSGLLGSIINFQSDLTVLTVQCYQD